MSLLGKEVKINNNVEDAFLEQFVGQVGVIVNVSGDDDLYLYTVSFKNDEEIFTKDELDVLEGGF